MDNSSWEEFELTLNKVAWYGEVFIKAEGGINWNKVGGISIYTTPWIDYYLHLENGKFNKYCDELTQLNLGNGESDIVIERLGQLVKEFDGLQLTNGTINVKASIKAYSVGRIKEGLNDLLSKNITLHDFWTSGEEDEFVVLRVNNYKCMSILKATYKNIIHSLQSQEAKHIKILESKVLKYQDLVKEHNAKVHLLEYEGKRNLEDLAQIKAERKELSNQNIEFSMKIIENKKSLEDLAEISAKNKKLNSQVKELFERIKELKDGIYIFNENEDLPTTTTFKMVLLYRLGLLERDIWPAATREKIARVLGKIIGEENYETVAKFKEHLNNGTVRGQSMLRNNDDEVEKFLKESFKDINLKNQKFIMLLEKKKK